MKGYAAFILATATLATAQVTYNATTGVYDCDKANVAYCAGTSLGTDIIIRCDAQRKGQPGRCTNNLAGQPPFGVQPALCYESSNTSGDAACEKNCVVYGEDDDATFTLPAAICTPYFTATASSASATTTTRANSSVSTSSRSVTSATATGNVTLTRTLTTTRGPSTLPTTVTTTTFVRSTGTGGPSSIRTNSTRTGTNTPSGPTRVGPTTVPTAGAVQNGVGMLALAGVVFAALL